MLVAVTAFAVMLAVTPVANAVGASMSASPWTGTYVGLQVGSGHSESGLKFCDTGSCPAPAISTFGTYYPSVDSILAGGYLGYNYQMGRFVLGVEADLMAAQGNDAYASQALPSIGFGHEVEQSYFGTLRARAGGLVSSQLLAFVTAGVAFADLTMDNPGCRTCGTGGTTTFIDDSFTGWVIGGGLEYAASSSIHFKFEYLHSSFGEKDLTLGATTSYTEKDLTNNQFRIGISTKLGN